MPSAYNSDGTRIGDAINPLTVTGAVSLSGQPISVTTTSSTGITVQSSSTVNTPLAGLSVVTLSVPATGQWRVIIQMMLSGTGVPATNNNYLFDPISLPTQRIFTPTEKGVVYTNEMIYNLTGGNAIRITPNANEVSGVQVTASITLHRIS